MTIGATEVLAALDATGLPYEPVRIDPHYADTAAFCARYDFPVERSANSILVASRREPRMFALGVVLATTRLDVNKRFRALLDAGKLSFAQADDMVRVTGMEFGAVTPLGLPPAVPVYVDSRVMVPDWIILGGGDRTLKIKIAPVVLTKLGAVVVEDLAN